MNSCSSCNISGFRVNMSAKGTAGLELRTNTCTVANKEKQGPALNTEPQNKMFKCRICRPARVYQPLPKSWYLGLSKVLNSKTVNSTPVFPCMLLPEWTWTIFASNAASFTLLSESPKELSPFAVPRGLRRFRGWGYDWAGLVPGVGA